MRLQQSLLFLASPLFVSHTALAATGYEVVAQQGDAIVAGRNVTEIRWVSVTTEGKVVLSAYDERADPNNKAYYRWDRDAGMSVIADHGETIAGAVGGAQVDVDAGDLRVDGSGALYAYVPYSVFWRRSAGGAFEVLLEQDQPCPNDGAKIVTLGSGELERPLVSPSGVVALVNWCADGGLLLPGPATVLYSPASTGAPAFPGSTAAAHSWYDSPHYRVGPDDTLWALASVACSYDDTGCPSPYMSSGLFRDATPLAWRGQTAPGIAGGLLETLSPLTVNGMGDVLVAAQISVDSSTTPALYVVHADGSMSLVLRDGGAVPGEPGVTLALDYFRGMFLDDHGRVVFLAAMNNASTGSYTPSIWRWTPGLGLTRLIAVDDPTPGITPGYLQGIATLSVSRDGLMAFSGQMYGNTLNSTFGAWRESATGELLPVAWHNMQITRDGKPTITLGSTIYVGDPTRALGTGLDGREGWFAGTGDLLVAAGNGFSYSTVLLVTEPPRIVNLRAIEVTQAVQDWHNSVPLVAGKRTFVRAFFDANEPTPVQARLRAYRDGLELPGSPYSGRLLGNSMRATGNLQNVRPFASAATLFELPASWVASSGPLELEVELAPGGGNNTLSCGESAGPTPEDCRAVLAVDEVPELDVRLVSFDLVRDGVVHVGVPGGSARLAAEILTQYPISRLSWTGSRAFIELPPSASADASLVLATLVLRTAEGCRGACRTLYYAHHGAPDDGGLAIHNPGHVAAGPARFSGYWRYTQTHELGHLLGRHHAVSAAKFVRKDDGRPQGACGEVARTSAPDFPFWDDGANPPKPTLGPLGDPETETYGFDAASGQVVNPRERFELMSYCGEEAWPSSLTYVGVKDAITERFAGPPPVPGLATSWVQLVASAELSYEALVEDLAPDADALSTITVRDRAGNEVYSGPAEASAFVQRGTPGAEERVEPYVLARYPADVEAGEIVVHEGSIEVLRRVASAHAPVVSITSPSTGAAWSTENVTLAWTMTDADGDPLTATVSFSADGGLTWRVIVAATTRTSLTLPRAFFSGSTDARLRVDVSDGVNLTRAQTAGAFTVTQLAPLAHILAPVGGTLLVTADGLTLRGGAQDAEDGALTGSSLVWASSLAGALGTGELVELAPGALGVGTHVITLTATDSSLSSGSATVTVRVVAAKPATSFDRRAAIRAVAPWLQVGVGGAVELTVTNEGPDAAEVTTLAVTVPAGLTVTDDGACAPSGANLSCPVEGLAAGASVSFSLTVSATSAGAFSLSAALPNAERDLSWANDVAELVLVARADAPPAPGPSPGPGPGVDPGDDNLAPDEDEPGTSGGCACNHTPATALAWMLVLSGALARSLRRGRRGPRP